MALRKGDTCYHVVWDGPKIEYWEYVLRTIQTRKAEFSWATPITWGYWWNKLPGQTWGKLSNKHFDYGWLPNAWHGWRERHPINGGRPYAATKLGAIKSEIATLRGYISEHGADYDYDDEGVTLGRQLSLALAAQKRLRKTK